MTFPFGHPINGRFYFVMIFVIILILNVIIQQLNIDKINLLTIIPIE